MKGRNIFVWDIHVGNYMDAGVQLGHIHFISQTINVSIVSLLLNEKYHTNNK